MTDAEGPRPGAPAVALPAESLVLGPRDALVVLTLRNLRRATWLVIPSGMSVALLAGVSEDRWAAEYATVGDGLHALISPLWLLTIGVLLRIAIGPLAYLVAVVVTCVGRRDVRQAHDARSRWSRLTDVFRVAGGLRALRWTLSVRDQAVLLAGRGGEVLRTSETVVGWLVGVAWAVFLVVVVTRTG